jgi:hypothetical protein
MSRTVLLGNSNAIDPGTREPIPGKQITTVHVPEGDSVQEFLRTAFHADGFWPQHSSSPRPDWVESTDETLAQAVSLVTECPVGRPADWDEE